MATSKMPEIKRPDPVELVRQLLIDEELVRPVKIPLMKPLSPKRKVRKVKDRKPTLPTRVILPPKPALSVDDVMKRPVLLIKPLALPPPAPTRRARVYVEPSYPITSPKKNRLPQQPSKYVLQSTIYHTLAEPSIRDHTPPPAIKALPPRSVPIWTDLYRKQAISKAMEVVMVPELKSLPPRPVKVQPHKPLELPAPAGEAHDWIDVTDYEMPIRGARRRHLVMPTENSFERQMTNFTLEMNQHKVKREEAQLKRDQERIEENIQSQERVLEAERRRRVRRPMSLPPAPRIREFSPRKRDKTPEIPKVTPLPPNKMDEWNLVFKRQATRALAEPTAYSIPNYHSSPHRRRPIAPSRIWMPSNEYHIVTEDEIGRAAHEYTPHNRQTPDPEDYKLRALKDDIELNKRRRNKLREQRLREEMSYEEDTASIRDMKFEVEQGERRQRMRSMPPKTHRITGSPTRRISPQRSQRLRSVEPLRQRLPHARALSMPPQELNRGRHVAHLPSQPSKFWMPSGEYHHITEDEFRKTSNETTFTSENQYQESDKLRKLQEEFERDQIRRENRRRKHQQELATVEQEDEESYRRIVSQREKRQRRMASMPPIPQREYITAGSIPRSTMRPASPPADYKPRLSNARQQEIEIETITKRINENIEEYEESLKRRQHHTVPNRKVIATPFHSKPKGKRTKWSNLYTTVTRRIEDQSESDEEEEWVTIKKRRGNRHLVVPSSELSRSLREESTRHPMPKPHFTEDANFDSDWHAMTPHVHSTQERRARRNVGNIRHIEEKHAATFDKRTPAADDWVSSRSRRSAASSSSSLVDHETVDHSTFSKTKRHLVTPPFVPRRHPVRDEEPISMTRLNRKTHHTRHLIEEREASPERMFRTQSRRARHNLVMPGWNPGESSTGRSSRRDSPPKSRVTTSSSVDRHSRLDRSFTPFGDIAYTSPSPTRPVSLGRRASVSHLPRSTPARDTSLFSTYEQSSIRSGSLERKSLDFDIVSTSSSRSSEHHVHPMRDTFKGAADRVRERLPWRDVYNKSMEKVYATACKCIIIIHVFNISLLQY